MRTVTMPGGYTMDERQAATMRGERAGYARELAALPSFLEHRPAGASATIDRERADILARIAWLAAVIANYDTDLAAYDAAPGTGTA